MRTLLAVFLVLVLFGIGFWFMRQSKLNVGPGQTPEALQKVGPTINPCGQGHDRPNPVVCVDANFTTVTPLLVHVKSNEWVNFYVAGSNGDLDVQFTAVTPVHHAHHGAQEAHHYRIQAKVVSQQTPPFKYRLIERDSGKEIDPEIMIDP